MKGQNVTIASEFFDTLIDKRRTASQEAVGHALSMDDGDDTSTVTKKRKKGIDSALLSSPFLPVQIPGYGPMYMLYSSSGTCKDVWVELTESRNLWHVFSLV